MSRQIEYRINNGTIRGPVASANPLRITGLTNDTPQDIDIRVVDDGVASSWSNVVSVTPTAPDVIMVDNVTGTNDTEKINNAIDLATGADPSSTQVGQPIQFGSGVYYYNGSKTINSSVTFLGTQPAYGQYEKPNTSNTTINLSGTLTLDAPVTFGEDGQDKGIWLRGNYDGSYHARTLINMRNGGALTAYKSYFSGVQSTSNTSYGLVISHPYVETGNNPGDIYLKDCKVFDAQHAVDPEVVKPLLRLINTSAEWTGNFDAHNTQFFECGNLLQFQSGNLAGNNIIHSNSGIYQGAGNEVDMLNINRDGSGTGTTTWRSVTLWGCPFAYIKTSEGHGHWDVDGVTFKIPEGDRVRGRLVRFQNDDNGPGLQYAGTWLNITLDFDFPPDQTVDYCRPDSFSNVSNVSDSDFERTLFAFDGMNVDNYNLPEDFFIMDGIDLNFEGELSQPLIAQRGYNRLKLKNVSTSSSGSVKHILSNIYKSGRSDLENVSTHPDRAHWNEFENCPPSVIGNIVIVDSLRLQFANFGTENNVYDRYQVKVSGETSFNVSNTGLVDTDTPITNYDIVITNEDNWHNEPAIDGIDIRTARNYSTYTSDP